MLESKQEFIAFLKFGRGIESYRAVKEKFEVMGIQNVSVLRCKNVDARENYYFTTDSIYMDFHGLLQWQKKVLKVSKLPNYLKESVRTIS